LDGSCSGVSVVSDFEPSFLDRSAPEVVEVGEIPDTLGSAAI